MPALVRRVLVTLAIAAVAAVLVTLASCWVLLGTTTGAGWALSWVSGSIPAGSLTVREVRGALSSPLELVGIEFRTASLSVSVERLTVRWRLQGLLRRSLEISALEADSVRVRQLAPPPSGAARTDTLPEVRLPIALRVDALAVRGLLYVPFDDRGASGGSGSFTLDDLRAAGDFRGDRLRVSALRARSRLLDVDLRGELRPRREYPMDLDLDWAVRLPERPELRGRARVTGSVERAHVTARLEKPFEATADAVLSQLLRAPFVDGRLEFTGLEPDGFVAGVPAMRLGGQIEARGTAGRFEASGRLSMRSDSLGPAEAAAAIELRGDSLRVHRLLVNVPGRRERVQARGLLTGLGETPRAEFVADWQDLVWPPSGDTLVRSDSGRLRFAGTSAHFTLDFDGGIATAREDFGTWGMAATGDSAHLDVASLEGPLYGGHVVGSGTFAWQPHPSWRAAVSADSLDPGFHWPEWPGRLGIELEVEGQLRDTTLELEARIAKIEGTLRELPVTGHGNVTATGSTWGARDLRLAWGEARLAADGLAGDNWRLAASLTAPDIGPAFDGASGALSAELKLSGPRARPHVELVARGDSLGLESIRIGTLDVRLGAGLNAGDSLRLDLEARQAMIGMRPLELLSLEGAGSTSRHTLSGRAHAEGDTVAIELSGGLEHERWSGHLDALEVTTRSSGAWRLEAPVAVTASAGEASIDSFCVRSAAASVRGVVDWGADEGFRARVNLAALPLGAFDRWLPVGTRLYGTLEGSIDAAAERPEGPLTATVRLAQGPAMLVRELSRTERDTIPLGEGTLAFDSDAQGARGSVAVRWKSGDHLDARVELPGFNVLSPDTLNQRIEGSLRMRANDLSMLDVWVPGLDQSQGVLSADLELSGTMRRPDIDGEASLRDGRASIPALGVTLQDAGVTARFEAGHRIRLEGTLRSGSGAVALNGEADLERLDLPLVTLGLKGTDFTVAKTREADVRVSPDLHVKLQRSRIDVEGQVDIPFARLVTIDKFAQLPVPRSSDVVFIGQEQDSSLLGPKLHSRVRLVIGEDVEIRVPGFRGRPEGSILAIDEPGQVTRATGELSVREGSYRAYGQDLRIERGRLSFGGGPITNPGLDLRASRTATDGTVAGIQITGTAEAPILTTFSVPAMSQADALSYIMFGKPLGETGGNGGAAAQAASQLSLQGGDVLARSVAGQFGIQDASIESKEGSMQEASLFLGTYLSPKLYVSYGIGLFNSETTVRVRYKLNNRWSVQSESGTAPSGLVQFTGEK